MRYLCVAALLLLCGAAPRLAAQAPTAARPELVQPGEGEYLLPARTIIQGQLVTGIHSDLPGTIVAQITRDVWDQQQRVVLVPRGSFLTGSYGNVQIGQDRLAIAWTQLELPNGARYPLPGLWGTDREGSAGVQGRVDHNLGRVFRAMLLSSVITYGAATRLSDREIGYLARPSPRDQAISGGVQQIQGVTERITERDLEIRPTVRIPQGKRFSIIVGQDLILPAFQPRR